MLKFSERTDSWNMMMLSPSATAAKYAKRGELGFRDGLENFGTPIIMVYLPLLLITFALSGNFNPLFLLPIVIGLAFIVLWIFLFSFAFAALSYGTGALLGGKAKFGRLYYMISLASAPTFVFTLVFNVASILLKAILAIVLPPSGAFSALSGFLSLAGNFVALSVTIYGMYLLTVSMGALYKFGKAKSVAVWLVPLAILFWAGIVAFGTLVVVSTITGVFRFF
ncbi:MAG: hypothetical protein WCT52_03070 [Candidatus Micrarchaeia archaeon]